MVLSFQDIPFPAHPWVNAKAYPTEKNGTGGVESMMKLLKNNKGV